MPNTLPSCHICHSTDVRKITTVQQSQIYHCNACTADFAQHAAATSSLVSTDHFATIDLEKYFRSVKATRESSYIELLSRIQPFAPGKRWLDVGCSYGWLLQFLHQHGFDSEGIEPSADAAEHARRANLQVHSGLFPAAVPAGQRYDVISFMDVLEHLENPAGILAAAKQHLSPQGLLVIQVPDQACFLYRLANWLHWGSVGRLNFALRRLWLLDFDFPHVSYFGAASLTSLLTRSGWKCLTLWRSPLGNPTQAFDRVGYAKQSGLSRLTNPLVALGVASIQWADTTCGHGGLLTIIAQPTEDSSG